MMPRRVQPSSLLRGPPSWRDEALLLVTHGAPRFPDAERAVRAHAAAIRTAGCFAEVATAALNGAPTPAAVLAGLRSGVVHVVPFFMEQGWFVTQAVPRALAGGECRDLRWHPPVGLHPALADRAAARVIGACGSAAPGFSVVLLGHGSARQPGRLLGLHRHVAALAARRDVAAVRAAFLEEAPFLPDVLRDWQDRPVAVVGWFAIAGSHVHEALPSLWAAARRARGEDGPPLLNLGSIADDPAMPRIILDQAAA